MCSPRSVRWRCVAASSSGGPGEHLDLSMLEAMTLMQSSEWLHSQLLRVPPVSRTTEVPSIEPAKDGYVGITMVTGQQWLDFAAMVECPQLEEIEQLRFQIGRWAYRDLIREQIGPWMAERTVEEIVELGQLFRLPIAALGNGSTIRDSEYVRQREVFVRNPAGFHQPRPPWLMSAVRARARCAKPLPPGADNDESPWQASKPEHQPTAARRAARRRSDRRSDGVLGRAGRNPPTGRVRRRGHQGGVDPAPGRHPLLGRHAQRCGRLVGVRLGVPGDEHQQAFGHPGFGLGGGTPPVHASWRPAPTSSSRTSRRA